MAIAKDSAQILLIRFSCYNSTVECCRFSIEKNRFTNIAVPSFKFVTIQRIRFFQIFSFWRTFLRESLSDGIVCTEFRKDESGHTQNAWAVKKGWKWTVIKSVLEFRKNKSGRTQNAWAAKSGWKWTVRKKRRRLKRLLLQVGYFPG